MEVIKYVQLTHKLTMLIMSGSFHSIMIGIIQHTDITASQGKASYGRSTGTQSGQTFPYNESFLQAEIKRNWAGKQRKPQHNLNKSVISGRKQGPNQAHMLQIHPRGEERDQSNDAFICGRHNKKRRWRQRHARETGYVPTGPKCLHLCARVSQGLDAAPYSPYN